MLRLPAPAHIKAMHRVSHTEQLVTQAARISGLARPFEAMHQHDVALPLALGALRIDGHLDIRRRAIEHALYRPTNQVFGTRPEIARDGRDVRIAKERIEWRQWS